MDSRDLAIFFWAVIAGVSLLLILQDAIFNLEKKENDDEI